jgi:hypothetical protein
MAKKNELEKSTPAAPTPLALAKDLLPEDVDFNELLENLAEMDEVEFPRIRHKTGKFYFSDDDKGTEEFEAVVLFYGKQNTYWDGNYDPKNISPPECFSVDGSSGSKPRDEQGRFGSCGDCALNQFGSGTGRGKACRNQLKLYVQKLGTTVPMTLFLAPTSIRAFESNYIIHKVTQKGLSYPKVVTKFTSYQQQGETHFRINFEIAGVYKGEEADSLKKLREYWLKAIKKDRARLDMGQDHHESKADSGGSNTRTVEPRPAPSGSSKPAPTPAAAPAGIQDDEDMPF